MGVAAAQALFGGFLREGEGGELVSGFIMTLYIAVYVLKD